MFFKWLEKERDAMKTAIFDLLGAWPRMGDVVWSIDCRTSTWRRAIARDPFAGGRYFQVTWKDGTTSPPVVISQHGWCWYFEDEWRVVASDARMRGPRVGDGVRILSLSGWVSTSVRRTAGEDGLAFQVEGKEGTWYRAVNDGRWEWEVARESLLAVVEPRISLGDLGGSAVACRA